jgi:single-strand DNA-binding protein
MGGLNKVFLIGNMGADPEARFTQAGKLVLNFRLATNTRYRDKDGNTQEHTEWHKVVVFGRLAEILREHGKTGKHLYVEGHLETTQWEDQEGHKRQTTKVVLDTFQFLSSANGNATAREAPPRGISPPAPVEVDPDVPF